MKNEISFTCCYLAFSSPYLKHFYIQPQFISSSVCLQLRMSVRCDVNEVTHLWFPAMKRQLEREKMVQVYGLVSFEVSYRY